MTLSIRRGISYDNLVILQDDRRVTVSVENFRRLTGALDAIRILDSEYCEIDEKKKYLAHFNLEDTDSVVGNIYVLAKIVERGFFDNVSGEEKPPTLSLKDVIVVRCVKVENNVPYGKLTPEYFNFSMKHIRDVPTLKDAIVKRYGASMPRLSREEILSLGVSWQLLEILDRKSFTFDKVF